MRNKRYRVNIFHSSHQTVKRVNRDVDRSVADGVGAVPGPVLVRDQALRLLRQARDPRGAGQVSLW